MTPAALLVLVIACLVPAPRAARADALDSGAQRHLREATFEVVQGKPDGDPLSYEKPLPLELLPFNERTAKVRSIGTAFAIARDRFVTAAHVLTVGAGSQYGPFYLRDATGRLYPLDSVIKFATAEDYAVFTVRDPPRVSPLDTRGRPSLNDPVYAVGNALGEGIIIRDGLYTSDTPEEIAGRWKWLRFSAAASPGNSGGPLVDRSGRVIGVVVRKSPSENLNVALAIDQVLAGSEQAATMTGRTVYRLPTGATSDAAEINEQFPLPKPMPEFLAALVEAANRADAKIRAAYAQHHHEHTFPNGPESTQLLHSLYVSVFPRLISEKEDGMWGVNEPTSRRAQLEANGVLDVGTAKFGEVVRLRVPDGTGLGTLYGDSKLFMDLLLKGITVRRPVGQDSVRVTSLGKASEDTTYVDGYGRVWQLRLWPVPFSDMVAITLMLPTPEGYVGFIVRQPTSQHAVAMEELRGLTGFTYVSLEGTLAQWQDYLLQGALLPAALKSIELKVEPGRQVRYTSKRASLTVTGEVQKVALDNLLRLDMGYYVVDGAPVWDVGGIYLADSEQRGNFVYVNRRQKPLASMPETYTRRWQSLIDGMHPYTATVYTANGTSQIDTVANAEDLKSGRSDIGYTLRVVREGTEAQEPMAARLRALRAGFRILEH